MRDRRRRAKDNDNEPFSFEPRILAERMVLGIMSISVYVYDTGQMVYAISMLHRRGYSSFVRERVKATGLLDDCSSYTPPSRGRSP